MHQLAAQGQPVGQVAVMADREAAAVELGEQRLHVAQDGFARGGIAHVPDRRGAGQVIDHLAAGETLADEAHAALGVEPFAVEGDDARGFLAAVLEGMHAERGDRGGVRMVEDAEDAALFAQTVPVEVQAGGCDRSIDHVAHLAPWLFHRVAALPWTSRFMPVRSDWPYPAASRAGLFRLPRWSGGPSCGSPSSGLGRLSRFKMVFSGSSGNIDISQSPVDCRTTLDLALATQAGCVRGGTSQAKNRKATTTMIRPRPSPNRKPSVRSSAPTRLSSTMSENRTVMIDTMMSVSRKVPAITSPAATMSVLKYVLA